MKNRTTSQTTGPDKRDKRTTTNTTPGTNLNKRTPNPEVKNPAVSAMEMRSIMESAMREGAMKGGIQGMIQDYNNIPFKNNAIDVLKRRRYDISSEFDGQEVQGTLTERPTLGGGMVETERYNMPGGGTLTITDSASFPIGFYVDVLQTTTSQVTIAGTSFTPDATPGLKLRARWSSATLIKRALDSWVVLGDLSA